MLRRLLCMAAVMLTLGIGAATAQMPEMPLDTAVRIGTLPNGLTYYIRHNETPKGQAEFYIAQNVGSILEEDNQRGLAHFLEHMCFNGTTHFPGKDIINWLESVGVKFGRNLNAQTGVDHTIYNISNVPVERTGVQDSCLLILHDWANDLLLEPDEIDAERAVIHEEWRTGQGGQMRALEPLLPVIYPDSRYGYRLPIGTMEVIDNFPHQALRDYYERWYRPDLQAVVVVGDIDVDYIEGKIKEMFSDIEMPDGAPERVFYPVGDTPGTIYAIGHDKEMPNTLSQLMIKSDPLPREMRNTPVYYSVYMVEQLVAMMANEYLNDVASRADAPFAMAQLMFDDFFLAKTKEAMTLITLSKDSTIVEPTAAAYRELLRLARGGFTQDMLDRAKATYISSIERSYANRDKRQNGEFVHECINHYLDGEPMPGIETEVEILKQIVNMLNLQQINQVFAQAVTPDNRVLLALMPDNAEGIYPTPEQFGAAFAAVEAEEIAPLEAAEAKGPFIPELRAPGKVTSVNALPQWGDGTQEWTLSNGAKVIVKPTDLKADEILFTAVANNGTVTVPDSKAASLIFGRYALGQPGFGDYSNADVSKYLAGKQASINLSFSAYSRSISGSTIVADLPTLMELIYQSFGNVSFTDEEFEALRNTFMGVVQSQVNTPGYIFGTDVMEALYQSPKLCQISPEAIAAASRTDIIEIAAEMTANAADWTFIFVGTVDPETLKPLVEQYIASLPGDPETAVTKPTFDPSLATKGGNGIDSFTTKMETPQTYAYIELWGNADYTPVNTLLATAAGQVLAKRLLDEVREKEGAVYSIGASGSLSRNSDQPLSIMTQFPMKPEKRDRVLDIIRTQLEDMAAGNIADEELVPVREYLLKERTSSADQNQGWLGAITGWVRNGVDTYNGLQDTIATITPAMVSAMVKDLLAQDNYRVVILDPAE